MFKFKQVNGYYCGPACLRIVEYLIGYKPTGQHTWAKRVGTTKDGTGILGVKRGLKALGCAFDIVRGNVPYLGNRGIWIVWDEDQNHWMVLYREITSMGGGQMWENCLYNPLLNKPISGIFVEQDYMSSDNSYALRIY